MSVTMQERQLDENHRNLKEQITRLQQALNISFKTIVSPGDVPENLAVYGSYLTISLIFFLDVITGPIISFHILYAFPIAFIALHSSRTRLVVGAVALSISLPCMTLFFFQSHALGIPIYLFWLITFSNIIGTLIARYARAHTLEVSHLSTTDPLTQLYNRQGLDKALEREIMRQRRYGGHFSVAVLDLDGFKGLNNRMGYNVGDKALILLADMLRDQIRQTDTIARLGGDAFVVLMPNTQASDCRALCIALSHAIRTRLTAAFSCPLSASIGFTTSHRLVRDSVDILSTADTALRRAKALGKGCVIRACAKELKRKDGKMR